MCVTWVLLRKEQSKRSDPSAGFYSKVWSETSMGQTLANRYINGKTKSIPRTIVGLRSANSIQQGKAKRDNPGNVIIIQAGENTIRNRQDKINDYD